MNTRILIFTQLFDPEPTFKGLVFARELVRLGFEVEVVTGFPNYPGGKIYKGYKINLLQREFIDGVNITRIPLYPSHNQSIIKRMFTYISFAASLLIYGLFFAKRANAIYVYHPPLTVSLSALFIKMFRNIPILLDIQDMWPDSLCTSRMLTNSSIINFVGKLCDLVYKNVDMIAVQSPGFKKLLISRGVANSKIDIIYNWADEKLLSLPKGKLPLAPPKSDKFRIVFAGNMGKAQGLDTVLKAASLLQSRNSSAFFIMIGTGVEVLHLQKLALDLKLMNLIFLPPVPMDKVGAILSKADILLVHLRKDPLFKITIPSKTQAYMAVGKPLLMAVDGDAADIVIKSKCGVVARSGNAESLAKAVGNLESMHYDQLIAMGLNAKNYYQANFSLYIGINKFYQIFNRIKK
jgi:colanic acid biosynthesis glycosyl transferase WcaI